MSNLETEPCFECGASAAHNLHVVPQVLGGKKTVPLCASCAAKVKFAIRRELQPPADPPVLPASRRCLPPTTTRPEPPNLSPPILSPILAPINPPLLPPNGAPQS